jgi:transposase
LHLQSKGIKEEVVIAYLDRLHLQVPGPLVLVLDRLPAHRSRNVADYMAENASWLRVEWLPAYAPELNPVEYAWSTLKGKPLANLAPDKIEQLEHTIKRVHRNMRKQSDSLQQFLIASSLYTDELFVKAIGEGQ